MSDVLTILLAGGRNLPEPGIVSGTLADIALNIADGPIVVRHGACPGDSSADDTASVWIRECGEWLGVTEDPMPADWDHCAPNCPTAANHRHRKKPGDIYHPGICDDYCPSAGPRRNGLMVAKKPRPDYMLAFPDPTGPSYGTRGCMRLARAAGIEVREVTA
jgi:hypothetical protein